MYILNSKDEGYKKHGKKRKQDIEFVKAQEEDIHGHAINSIYAYLKCDDGNHMIVMEGQCSILQDQLKNDDEGGRNMTSSEKINEVGHFKEWKVGTSSRASMLEYSDLIVFQVEHT